MTGAEKLREEGREQGLEAGRAEALTRLRALVSKLLHLRFGPLPAAARDRIDSADMDQLDLFSERVDTAASLDEVLHG